MAEPPSVQQILLDRLASEGLDRETWALDVLAASEGAPALASLLDDGVEPRATTTRRSRVAAAGTSQQVPHLYLQSILVRGFRGIGPQALLRIPVGPGLTLVIGRNGSGKSSFAEALEVLLTGDSFRWRGKGSRFWKAGWSNLHDSSGPLVRAEFLVEGTGAVSMERAWEPEADVGEATTRVQRKGEAPATLAEAGWGTAVEDYRPFMSHSELESMLEDGPTVLYRALLSGLGLERIEVVRETLAKAQSERKKRLDEAKKRAQQVASECRSVLEARPDDRVRLAVDLLGRTPWDFDRLESLVAGEHGVATSESQLLERLSRLEVPDAGHIGHLAEGLRRAARHVSELGAREAGRARELAGLLESALRVTEGAVGESCPVCGTAGVINEAWRASTRSSVQRVHAEATELARAESELREFVDAARMQCSRVPTELTDPQAEGWGAIVSAREAWARWRDGRQLTDPVELAGHLELRMLELEDTLKAAVKWAQEELARRHDAWRPLAASLAAWLPAARVASRGASQLPRLKDAEKWVVGTIEALREERFRPIETRAIENWSCVRLQSNVELTEIALKGKGRSQSVELKVAVDGEEAGALGVMSQGELNSLVLSLFLPRALLAENPFGFVIVDDPVQAMDPARVEGLARLLEKTARERQVVVFTHDDRLPEAVRRLQIPAHMIQVTRRAGSVVELKTAQEPVDAYLSDARSLVKAAETDGIPPAVIERVVPGFCRLAVEAACTEAVRRRRLSKGDAHAAVEATLEDARTLYQKVALALSDDATKGGEVLTGLKNRCGVWAVDVFKSCNEGAHGDFAGDLARLVESTGKLTGKLRELR